MSFRIIAILDSQPEGTWVSASHQSNQITALIVGKRTAETLIGKSLEAEIGYDQILRWSIVDDFEDAKSGIWQAQDGIHLLGRVHNVLNHGDGKVIVDVYMQNGSEFFSVDSETIDEALEANNGLEITVKNLYIRPLA